MDKDKEKYKDKDSLNAEFPRKEEIKGEHTHGNGQRSMTNEHELGHWKEKDNEKDTDKDKDSPMHKTLARRRAKVFGKSELRNVRPEVHS